LIKEGYRPVDKFPHETLALPISLEGKYGNEYWLGLHNFYVIGRYNPRTKYAMAVYQLSQQIQTSICKMNNICPPTS
jgi:membrane-bound lytic murein transglycosylase B